MNNKYLTGVFFCLIATLSWGGMFPVMTSALKHMDPFNFTALRYGIAGIAFVILLIMKEGATALSLKGERVLLAWLFGTAGFAGFGFLVFLGQKLSGPTGALTASIIMATMPLLALLVIWVVKSVRPPLFSLLFILMSFSGVVLVITKGDFLAVFSQPQNLSANVPILLGALCWVIYTIGASFFPKWSAYRYTAVTTLLGLVSIFAINYILVQIDYIQVPSIQQIVSVLPHLLYMSLVAGFIGVLSWNMGNKIITPMNGVLFMDVVPLTAFTISAITGTVPIKVQVIGACITATALVLNNLYQRQRLVVSNRASVPLVAAGGSYAKQNH
jgi:drug/metabolite transporter (DMT)-like permease